jgi:hypothetical protein
MKRLLLTVPIILLFIGCAEDPIIGQWERFGDDAAGSIVQVEVVGKLYHGRLLRPAGVLELLGFAENDIKWRDIVPVGPNKWKGRDLIKMVDPELNITSVHYKDVYFTLLDNGVLEVRKFVKEQELVGTVQTWRRVE